MNKLLTVLAAFCVSAPALANKQPAKPRKIIKHVVICKIQQKQISPKTGKESTETVKKLSFILRQAKGHKTGSRAIKLENPQREAIVSARYGTAQGIKRVLEITFSDSNGAMLMSDNVVEKEGKAIVASGAVTMDLGANTGMTCNVSKRVYKKGPKKPVTGNSDCPGKKLCRPPKK